MFHKFVTQIRGLALRRPWRESYSYRLSLQQIVAVGDQFDYRSARAMFRPLSGGSFASSSASCIAACWSSSGTMVCAGA